MFDGLRWWDAGIASLKWIQSTKICVHLCHLLKHMMMLILPCKGRQRDEYLGYLARWITQDKNMI